MCRYSTGHCSLYAFFRSEPPLVHQSLARRRYNERKKRKPETQEQVEGIDHSCTWDDEAIEEAIKTAQHVEAHDPQTATLLRAQAQFVRQKRYGEHSETEQIYDPMALYARVLKFYE